jgi:hypothetical protein
MRLMHGSQMKKQTSFSTRLPNEDWGAMIMKEKIRNKFGDEFLPADKIELFTTNNLISEALREEYNSESQVKRLKDYIRNQPAKLTFLLLVSMYKVSWMETLADPIYNFSDVDLPNSEFVEHCLQVIRNHKDLEIPLCNIVKERGKCSNDLRFFCSERWSVLAPIFTTNNFYQELHNKVRLPFLAVPDTPDKSGSFGTVCKVKLHHAHQSGIIESNRENIAVALKTIKKLIIEELVPSRDEDPGKDSEDR